MTAGSLLVTHRRGFLVRALGYPVKHGLSAIVVAGNRSRG